MYWLHFNEACLFQAFTDRLNTSAFLILVFNIELLLTIPYMYMYVLTVIA